MSLNTGYAGIFIGGNRFGQSRPGNSACMGAIQFGTNGFRKRTKIIFHPGMQDVCGSRRKSATSAGKRFVKHVLRQMVSIVSQGVSRLIRLFASRTDLESDPIRVHPLRKEVRMDPRIEGISNDPFEKSGRSDADALLEMKPNPVTSVYEVRRIIAAVG